MTLALALAEARSCLAALADVATDFDESVHFEHLLLDLDAMHPGYPGIHALTGTREELLDQLDKAVHELIALGADGLRIELLLESALQPNGPIAP